MFDFLKSSNMFDMEEKVILNHIGIGIGRNDCCEQLSFSAEVTEDQDCVEILHRVYEKVCDLTEEEWNELQLYLPFEVLISDDDLVSEKN